MEIFWSGNCQWRWVKRLFLGPSQSQTGKVKNVPQLNSAYLLENTVLNCLLWRSSRGESTEALAQSVNVPCSVHCILLFQMAKHLLTIAVILTCNQHSKIKHRNLSLVGIPWLFKLTCLFYSFPMSDFRFWPEICFGFRNSSQKHTRTNEKFQNQWVGMLQIFLQVCPVFLLYLLIYFFINLFF